LSIFTSPAFAPWTLNYLWNLSDGGDHSVSYLLAAANKDVSGKDTVEQQYKRLRSFGNERFDVLHKFV
jgi:hypothetical protein